MNGRGFLGGDGTLTADLSLVFGLGVALLLTVGVVMARRKRFETHRKIQSTAVALNVLQVGIVMIGSFFREAAPGIPNQLGETYYAVAVGHGLLGMVTLLFGVFVALRANELVPGWLRFHNFKLFMRTAYGLYMAATLAGVAVYLTWYTDFGKSPEPAVAEETPVVAVAAPAATPAPVPTLVPTPAPAKGALAIVELLEAGAGAPNRQGYAVGLRDDADALLRESRLIASAEAKGDLAGIRQHADVVADLLTGSSEHFGLLSNPTRRGWIYAVRAAAEDAAAAPESSATVRVHAGHVRICTLNLEAWAIEARDLVQELSHASSLSRTERPISRLMALSKWLAVGDDADGDGEIAPSLGEGGALVAFEHAQFMSEASHL